MKAILSRPLLGLSLFLGPGGIALLGQTLAPTITKPPSSATVFIGETVTFSVTASGLEPLSYQWNFAGKPIAMANSSTYAIQSVQPSHAGSYTVTVSNQAGSVTSSPANLTVLQRDLGDAPEKYPTKLGSNGARHQIVEGFFLGKGVDAEADGQPTASADGDDMTPAGAADDEDGVTFKTPLNPGQVATVEVVASGTGILDAWVDFNANQSWGDAGEQIFVSKGLVAGTNTLTFTVPADLKALSTCARFRFSRQGKLSFVGPAPDGEVEDYLVQITEAQKLDFGDAPDPTYPTTLKQDGARHVIEPGFHLGSLEDAEVEGNPNSDATGDDITPAAMDDEDGVTFLTGLLQGRMAKIQVVASDRGSLDAWIDFNRNGTWADASDQIFAGKSLGAGVNVLEFLVPVTAEPGTSFARFRLSRKGGYRNTGLAPDGEVEDYVVQIRRPCEETNEGSEFWLTFPGNYAPDPAQPVQLRLCILGSRGTTGVVSIPGLGFNFNFSIPGEQYTIVELPMEAELGAANDLVEKKGIWVVASAPVTVYGVNHVRYTTDGYLALPAGVLGREYVVQSFANVHRSVPELNGTQFALVATDDNTTVTVIPSVTTGSRNAGVPYSFALDAGHTYQLRNTNGTPADLSGTVILSDRPIAVFGSHLCANVASSNAFFCDHLVEHLLPVGLWSTSFLSCPLKTRNHGDTFRLLAAQDNTKVSINGAVVATLNRGKFHELVLSEPAYITSDRPISVTQYSNSSDYDAVKQADPFMVTMPPTGLFRDRYAVFSFTNDFSAHYLNLVVPDSIVGFVAVDGTLVPAARFNPIPASGYSAASIAVAQGLHQVTQTSAMPQSFGVIAYGFAEYDSYGYPGGMRFPDLLALRVSVPPSLAVNLAANTCATQVPTVPVEIDQSCAEAGQVKVTQRPPAGTSVGPGVYPITIAAADSSGRRATLTTLLTVRELALPEINCPRNIVATAGNQAGARVSFRITARTPCQQQLETVCTPPSGSLFPIGTTTVHCTAVSSGGLTNSCSFTVTVSLAPPRIQAAFSNRRLLLTWEEGAILESATEIIGPWTEVPSATSPYSVSTDGLNTPQRRFFRLKQNY
jgi:hypothetical protein